MKPIRKQDFPVDQVRRFMEPGPIVLVSSAWKGEANIMTMGWHMVMEFSPSLIGCYIWEQNYSREMIRRSRECVINIPTVDLAKTVVEIGNCSGSEVDKFTQFGLTAVAGEMVKAPLIAECFANLECRVADTAMVRKYNLFVLEVVKAHAPKSPKYPKTIHYRGDGQFMVAGDALNLRRYFRPEML
ncbi:flavin reductase family protein [Roseomonas xinghualingensis]|uniref:flavin reductase family protein n=1 Tax=Roseomonas xinghualingensis TaxID=2986475 RepID=UPI0021F1511D|nr:flavin reductase family protein [Roseomonas sp. SXEYE001]MCV4206384.1 flavin reductase family protein [Roseomonas sp. SXEYE001]